MASMQHLNSHCNGSVTLKIRTIVSMPEDREWPRDKRVQVPYCCGCRTVIDWSDARPINVQITAITGPGTAPEPA